MDRVVFAPHSYYLKPRPWLFLAGSIENGTAVDWQAEATEIALRKGLTILNPRRPDWDFSLEQSIKNRTFKEQVEWELRALDQADIVLFYFAPGTKSPISLLEFGRLSLLKPKQTIVVCPDGFWRKGNVDIVCEQTGVHTAPSIDTALNWLHWSVGKVWLDNGH